MVAGTRNPQTHLLRSGVASMSPMREAPRQQAREEQQPSLHTGNLRKNFRRLAKARTTGVLAALDYFAQLAQRNRYHYTDYEVANMERAIREKVDEAFEAFKRGTGHRPTFQFDDEEEDEK